MVVDQDIVENAASDPGRRPRRRRILASAAAVLVIAGIVTAVKIAFHYAHADALSCACGLAWSRQDNLHMHFTKAGFHEAMNVASVAPRRQTFYVEIVNDSSVTQTFLGLGHDESMTAYRGVLAISTEPNYPSDKTDDQLTYTTNPVDIPPRAGYTLRYTFTAACLGPGGSLIFDSLDVRVRTGWFTRVERVGFDSTSFVVEGTKASAKAGCPLRLHH